MTAGTDADPVLAEIVDRLVRTYQPTRIYLFGSRARGDARPDSDYDLLVIVPDSAPAERQRSGEGYRALSGTSLPSVDILVATEHWFDRRTHRRATLPGTVAREGWLVYAAA